MALPETKVTKPVSLGLRNIAHILAKVSVTLHIHGKGRGEGSRGGKNVLDFSGKVR